MYENAKVLRLTVVIFFHLLPFPRLLLTNCHNFFQSGDMELTKNIFKKDVDETKNTNFRYKRTGENKKAYILFWW